MRARLGAHEDMHRSGHAEGGTEEPEGEPHEESRARGWIVSAENGVAEEVDEQVVEHRYRSKPRKMPSGSTEPEKSSKSMLASERLIWMAPI